MRKLSKWLLSSAVAMSALSASAGTFVGDRSDFRDETIYFAITTRFYDGDPKNNVLCWDGVEGQVKNNDPAWRGDFKGLIEKLDYIKALGFTAIWITPIVQNGSGYDYHGYHAMDFSQVDVRYESRKEWGSAEDVKFQDLIDAAHAKGIKIILDIVLQHTGNFGENKLCHLFDRSQDIRNQANIEAALIPDSEKLGGPSYWDLPGDGNGKTQYTERFKYMKNTDGQNHDSNNYWHHVGTGWNWDEKNRWWGQIAGDCVDLNTENTAVVDYLVECYGKFIEMGVDGFRIDTTGHIAPLTFNSAFIPRFVELGEQYKNKRLNQAPFYMFGECCARFGEVIYRNQHILSSHYYTWKSDPTLVAEWKTFTPEWWAQQFVQEGAAPLGNMLTCEKDPGTVHNSDNAFMLNGAWHEPDYSDASGFNVIDFPMHYNYENAGQAVRIAKEGDHYYNDASWNVVYIDSHDYGPQPNDNLRFNGGTAQWAENLSMMFTFRGIPCLYYGSEVEFQKGMVIDNGINTPLKDTGRAYYGAYLEGNVTASDFGVFEASGNVKSTLDGDLAHHIINLNKIRAAVPALRKGQYTWDGCSANGGYAFKRAYKDSYALVAVNGGATFTSVPEGSYTDIVTGQKYTPTNGSITVSAPQNQGQLRVLVKGWTGDRVASDGKFMYTSAPVSHGGKPSFSDPGASFYYTATDARSNASVTLSPAGCSFKTETLTITAALNESAVSGWVKVGNQAQQTLNPGTAKTITIGEGMNFGETVTVSWSATSDTGESFTGSATYKKVDPNATITIYVTGKNNADISGTNLYAWSDSKEFFGAWPGSQLTATTTIDGREFYYATIDEPETVSVIFNRNGAQTDDISGITEDTYFEYDGGSSASKINVDVTPVPSVKFSPNGGEFVDRVNVTATVSNATSAWYKIDNGQQVNISGSTATFTLGDNMTIGQSVTVTWSASSATETKTGSVTFKKVEKQIEPEGITVYYDNSITNWSSVKIHYWPVNETNWPGVNMQKVASNIYTYTVPTGTTGVVFNNGGSDQTNDVTPVHGHIYKGTGNRNFSDDGIYSSGVDSIEATEEEAPVEYYNLQGVRVDNPTPGVYIQRQGNKVRKIRVL